MIELPRLVLALLAQRANCEQLIDDTTLVLNEVKAQFMALLGDHEIGTVYGEKVCTWKRSERRSIDTKAFKANEPDIASIYERVTPVRTLRFVERKEES